MVKCSSTPTTRPDCHQIGHPANLETIYDGTIYHGTSYDCNVHDGVLGILDVVAHLLCLSVFNSSDQYLLANLGLKLIYDDTIADIGSFASLS